jgi:hypothetical protein
MGYVAPITPYDHIQYANRTVGAARKEKAIHEIASIPATNLYLQEEDEGISFAKRLWPNLPDKRRKKNRNQVYKQSTKATEEAKAKITGKGMHINEVI